jgi:multisubunit Na+/H+ antiporter MnhB subunit
MDKLYELIENPITTAAAITVVVLVIFFTAFELEVMSNKRALWRSALYGFGATFAVLALHYSAVSGRYDKKITAIASEIQKPLPTAQVVVSPNIQPTVQ